MVGDGAAGDGFVGEVTDEGIGIDGGGCDDGEDVEAAAEVEAETETETEVEVEVEVEEEEEVVVVEEEEVVVVVVGGDVGVGGDVVGVEDNVVVDGLQPKEVVGGVAAEKLEAFEKLEESETFVVGAHKTTA